MIFLEYFQILKTGIISELYGTPWGGGVLKILTGSSNETVALGQTKI